MLTFERLLGDVGIDPTRTAVLRHTAGSPKLNALLPSFAAERRELFTAYQSVQGQGPAGMLNQCDTLAAFVGMETGRATFAGLWSIGEARGVELAALSALPHMAELMSLGMKPDETVFALTPLEPFIDWIGKLVIAWPRREYNFYRRAHNFIFPVIAITEENRFLRPLPSWSELSLSWSELALLPSTWRTAMAQWRGVYFIFDEAKKQGYVGSATGAENILGRWADYARSGNGGNVGMRGCRPEDLRFSILQLTAPTLPRVEVEAIEQSWMRRLHTREHGLNNHRL